MENVELRKDPNRKSKNKLKLSSLTSYFRSSKSGNNLISPPINFEKIDLIPSNVSPHISIQECPFDVTGYGMLIMKDKFKLKKPVKKKNVLVFMFERIIIITTEEQPDVYYYLGSIKMCDLSMSATTKRNRILLNDFNKNRNRQTHLNVEYSLKTKNLETVDKWRYTIEKCLWKELLTAREKSLEDLQGAS
ncbi:uncharacterized protein LOC130899327 [Diorhabda carinulata]|uniref:uncharacterized protein LOC130899327 n=1 Tax=Diorhabda carinulata TaxID=1163345 RepID=UPI0025A1E879|nr:uncharacterized protein LOC130899327 [Diorhabda carinulata]XP_057665185.1 uncharacterized protein LOC130899327 [Diorhabda carinulata]